MEKKVESGTALIIKGRTFELVWENETEGFNPCHHCALYKEICVPRRGSTLVDLCDSMQAEPNTYFVERKPEFSPMGVNEIEILVTALTEYKKKMVQCGNSARALKVLKMLDRI